MPLTFRRVSSSFYAAVLEIGCEETIDFPGELTLDDITFTREMPQKSFVLYSEGDDDYYHESLEPTHRLSGNYSGDFFAATQWSVKKMNQFGYWFGSKVANGDITGPYCLEDTSGRGSFSLSLFLFSEEDIRRVKERFPFISEKADAVERNCVRMSDWHKRYGWVPQHEKLATYCREKGIISARASSVELPELSRR